MSRLMMSRLDELACPSSVCGADALLAPRGESDVPVLAVDGDLGPVAIVALEAEAGAALRAGHGAAVLDLAAAAITETHCAAMLCGALRCLTGPEARLAVVAAPPGLAALIDGEALNVALCPSVSDAVAAITSRSSVSSCATARRGER